MKKKKLVTWDSLTKAERRLIRVFRRNGILITPEQVVKMHPSMHFWPTAKQLRGFLISVMDENGHFRPFMEGRNAEIDMAGKHERNVNFKELLKAKNLSLSLNIPRGFLSFSMHGGTHFMAQPVNKYHEEEILTVFLARYFQRLGKIPYRGRIRKNLIVKVRRVFEELERSKAERPDPEEYL